MVQVLIVFSNIWYLWLHTGHWSPDWVITRCRQIIWLPTDIFTTLYFTTWNFYHLISLPPYIFTTWYFYHPIFYHLIFLPPDIGRSSDYQLIFLPPHISPPYIFTTLQFYHLIFLPLHILPPHIFTTLYWFLQHFCLILQLYLCMIIHMICQPLYTETIKVINTGLRVNFFYIGRSSVPPYNKFYLLFAHPVFYAFYLLYVFRSS